MAGGTLGVWTGDPEAMVLDRPQHHPARPVRPDTAHHALVRLGRPGRLTSTSAAVPVPSARLERATTRLSSWCLCQLGYEGMTQCLQATKNRPAPQGVRAAAAVATVTCAGTPQGRAEAVQDACINGMRGDPSDATDFQFACSVGRMSISLTATRRGRVTM